MGQSAARLVRVKLLRWAPRSSRPLRAGKPPRGLIYASRVRPWAGVDLVWKESASAFEHDSNPVRLLLLTGQRRKEVAGIRWTELDFERAVWSLPADRTKNGQAHDVPLSDLVLEILRGREPRGERELIFGEGKGSFSGWSQAKARLDRRSDVSAWRLHDIRRTVVTGMAELGVQPHIIEAAVNHLSGHKAGVAGIYNRATYAAEKRCALSVWTDHTRALADSDMT